MNIHTGQKIVYPLGSGLSCRMHHGGLTTGTRILTPSGSPHGGGHWYVTNGTITCKPKVVDYDGGWTTDQNIAKLSYSASNPYYKYRLSQPGEGMRWLWRNMVVDGIRSDHGSMNNGSSLQAGYPYNPSPSHRLSEVFILKVHDKL